MKKEDSYRNNRAIGALLDEYEKAIIELKDIINPLSKKELKKIVDTKTTDKDCISIQSILTHVIRAGYNYVIEIRKWKGEELNFKKSENKNSIESYEKQLDKMFNYNLKLFEDYPAIKLEESDEAKKITVKWGQKYDVEQLFEHAIVHILRHRRQIERFIIKLKKEKAR